MNRLFFITLFLFSLMMRANHQKLNLQNAVQMNLVKAKAQSLGSHQGYCMNIYLKNLSNDSLIVIVEPGRRLNSLDDKNQDILIVKEEVIFLSKMEDKWTKVKGYCCQANNYSPPQDAKYDINTMADSGLVAVARYLNLCNLNDHVEQQAIWAISDKKPTANIADKTDSLIQPLRKLVANLKGEPLPWYTIISRTFVYRSGTMENFPQLLKGKLNYSNDKDGYVTLFILDQKGNPVCLVRNEWLKACANENYDLNIPIKGLAKGKYTIGLKSSDKELAKKEFEI